MMKLQVAPSSYSQKKKKQKSGGGQQQEQNPNVAESTRIRISQIIDQFLSTNDDMYAFEPNLTNAERAVVHELCRKLGLKSRSKGNGNKRHVCVHKIKKNGFTKDGKENCSSFTFSEDAKEVLQDLFTQYPPDDRDLGEETIGKHGGKTEKIREKRDDIFCKPSMNKAEIGRKVESFASKLEKSQELRQITEGRAKLPIASFRDVIMSTIESNQVVLISGETGCGKTTQVPQFLLDYMWGKGEACKIVCTQPRRISATSVAERISRERGENVGDSVGYKIRLETKGGKNSSVVFCTNGVLLRVLVSKGTERLKAESSKRLAKDAVSDLTHIIVDEIHERDRYSDFMLAILRDMLPSYPQLRLVLMSATLDAERFSQYFGGSPIIRVPGFTYPVKTFFLEDVLTILKATENNHLDCASEDAMVDEFELGEEYKIALDEAINLAWLNDEFDTLRDLVSSERTPKVFNYQHSSSGVTPLMVFAKKGKVGDVCMLLSFGADCHLQDSDGITAPEWAERESQGEASEIIKKHMEKVHSNCEEDQELLDKYLSTSNPELVDVALIEKLLRKICMDSKDGAILVFLPGWDDINKMREKLLASPFFKDCSKFLIISLHSMVPSAEQRKVFRRPPLGCRKIVLSTNIAETAITIDDVVYVIDSGRMKEKSYDPYNNVSTLQSSWVSKASAKQREGRAGRCQPGICYHLYSKLRAASMPDFQIPEIKRMPIEELCLQAKLIDPNCNIENFLRKTLDPPVFETIRNAIIVLQDIGALSHEGEQLTDLGEKLGSLPVHPLICKMLFFGILLNCLNPALTLACASDYRDPFILPMLPNDKKKAAAAKSHLASMFGGNSDQLAVVAAFECWMNAKKKGQEARFCSQYFVSSSTMNMLFGMRKQLQNELLRHGFIPEDVSNCSLNERNPGILHAVLVSGLYPMVARLLPPFKNTNRSMVETASGEKVRLHPHSSNFKLSFTKSSDQPLIIFDEITRGDGGMHIRNCSVVGPLPLLLLATEMVVVPIKDIDDDDDDNNNESDYEDADEDESDDDKIEMHNKLGEDYEEKVMSSPDNAVKVVVDRWLSFKSIALDVAQIYCLRERLSAAILLKVTHPRKVLSPLLEASLNAIASVLSYDGMSKISSPTEPVDSLTSMVNATEIDQSTHGKVKGMVQNSNGFLRSMPQAYRGTMSWNGPLSSHVQYPIASTHIKPYPRFAPQGPSGAISGPIALRGDSSKRQRAETDRQQTGTGQRAMLRSSLRAVRRLSSSYPVLHLRAVRRLSPRHSLPFETKTLVSPPPPFKYYSSYHHDNHHSSAAAAGGEAVVCDDAELQPTSTTARTPSIDSYAAIELALDSVVKIFTVSSSPNYFLPWQNKSQRETMGSGFVIPGQRILTNAHVVADHTFVLVRKHGSPNKYRAEVQAIGHECDLAILTVNSKEFWEGMNSLELGDIPFLQEAVAVVGYPQGGDNISVTKGVVSRVEPTQYVHGATQLMAIQIDAAINPGNSGGPAIMGNKVAGVAFQNLSGAENIGYIIPVPVIKHFIAGVEESGDYVGFCSLGLSCQPTENVQLREHFRMSSEMTGVLVTKINILSDAHSVLKKDDIILTFDGVPIGNDGTVPFRNRERITFDHLVSMKKPNETAEVRILRNGEEHKLSVTCRPLQPLVPVHQFDKLPSYFIFAGLVFIPLTQPYLHEYGEDWYNTSPRRLCERALRELPKKAGEQLVILSQVLMDDISAGYERLAELQVKKVNGVEVENLKHLRCLVEECTEEFLRFDLDDERVIVLNYESAKIATSRILSRHRIPSAVSADLINEVKEDDDSKVELACLN